MENIYAIGFDLGIKTLPWCKLLVWPNYESAEYVSHGTINADLSHLANLLVMREPQVVGVETPIVQKMGMWRNLFIMKGHSSMIVTTCKLGSIPVHETPAPTWRQLIGLGRTPSDAAIQRELRSRIHGFPRFVDEHTPDAAGVAFVAGNLQLKLENK